MAIENLVYKIGDISIKLSYESEWEYSRKGRFQDFLSIEIPKASFEVKVKPKSSEPSSPPIFDTGLGWRLYQEQGKWIVWAISQERSPYLVGYYAPDFHSGSIYTSPSDQEQGKFIFPLSYPMGELLMTNLLGTGYGIMPHSCGVIDAGDGIVFAGVSTAGKTTTARLWDGLAGVRVVNDDHTIIRKIDGQFRMYGTPWHGQGGMALADDSPLKKIFIIKHAPSNQAVRLSPAKAAASLLVRTFAPLWSAPAMAFTLQFIDELCHSVPCYELGFVPDSSAVEYVRCLPSN